MTTDDNAPATPDVQIDAAFHPVNAAGGFGETRRFCRTQTAPAAIGDTVWMGGGAGSLPGVAVGNNAGIGAGAS